ncbi:hypothetical protein [Zooshikella sp. RANM57]|uniref:hypothetical protein n=1 Tax=Zooshikella sp. RANM57 TaxID=3425863 RepID=UPI003D6EC18C
MIKQLSTSLLVFLSSYAIAGQEYKIHLQVKHNDKMYASFELTLPKDKWLEVQDENCTYSAFISELGKKSLIVNTKVLCGDDPVQQPTFMLDAEDSKGSMVLGDEKNNWQYDIAVDALGKI